MIDRLILARGISRTRRAASRAARACWALVAVLGCLGWGTPQLLGALSCAGLTVWAVAARCDRLAEPLHLQFLRDGGDED